MWTFLIVVCCLFVGWRLHRAAQKGLPGARKAYENAMSMKHNCPLCGRTVANTKFFTMCLYKCACGAMYQEDNIPLIKKGVCSTCKDHKERSKVVSFLHDPNQFLYKVGFECGRVIVVNPQTKGKRVINRCKHDEMLHTKKEEKVVPISSPPTKNSSAGVKFSPSPNILQYYKMLEDHDWSYMMSDDYRVCARGEKAEAVLKGLWKYDPRYETLYQEYSKYAWNNTQGVEKPTLESLGFSCNN